jgi:hypothetical protein
LRRGKRGRNVRAIEGAHGRVREGGMGETHISRNQTRNVCHVRHQHRAALLSKGGWGRVRGRVTVRVC